MSFELSYAEILALGESDEEDPVFELGLEKKHSKSMNNLLKVSFYPNILTTRLTHICFKQSFIK
jgi:hypothetical protein